VMQNFNDILNGVSDGSKDLSINALTVAGAASFNGAVTLGNATGDDLTFTGRIASDLDPKTAATYALGSSSLPWSEINIDNGATDGGAIYFGGSTTDFLKSDATTGGDLTMGGFTGFDLAANNKIKTFGTEITTTAKTGDYTVLDNDGLTVILVDANGADRVVTLPTADDNQGRIITVKKVDSVANDTVTIKSDAAGETIDGVSGTTGIELLTQYESLTVQCDNADWHIINDGRQRAGQYTVAKADIAADTGGSAQSDFEMNYILINGYVHFAGTMNITKTAATAGVLVPLPFRTTNFTDSNQCSGSVSGTDTARADGGDCIAQTTSTQMRLRISGSTTSGFAGAFVSGCYQAG